LSSRQPTNSEQPHDEGLTRREDGPWAYPTHQSPVEKTRSTGNPPGESTESEQKSPQPTIPPPAADRIDATTGLSNTISERYRLIRVLGKGGFANVYLAHDPVLDQDVAIKTLKLGLASQSEQDRFLFEARTGAKLRHPNIISVLDIVQSAEGLQMVMEYCPGGTLSDRVKKKGALRPRLAIEILRQVAQALSYAHRRNFVHRDVKPANIFMAGEGLVKLGDFGIAAYTDMHEFTATGMIIGTPLYMAPEQGSDSRDVDPRADVYSLGLTLYYMLTGVSPRVLDLDRVPAEFRTLIRHATNPDRNERLVSADQFIAMLDKIQAQMRSSPVTDQRPAVEPDSSVQSDTGDSAKPTPSAAATLTNSAAADSNRTVNMLSPAMPQTAPPMVSPEPVAESSRLSGWLLGVGAVVVAVVLIGLAYRAYIRSSPSREATAAPVAPDVPPIGRPPLDGPPPENIIDSSRIASVPDTQPADPALTTPTFSAMPEKTPEVTPEPEIPSAQPTVVAGVEEPSTSPTPPAEPPRPLTIDNRIKAILDPDNQQDASLAIRARIVLDAKPKDATEAWVVHSRAIAGLNDLIKADKRHQSDPLPFLLLGVASLRGGGEDAAEKARENIFHALELNRAAPSPRYNMSDASIIQGLRLTEEETKTVVPWLARFRRESRENRETPDPLLTPAN
jgi:serine/threonine-protein kinase